MTDEVRDFYNDFLRQRMVGYRVDGNARIEAAINLLRPFVKPGSIVADIGCGIGIVAEAIAMHEPTAWVIGVDISPANIEYARRTISASNLDLFAASVTDQFAEIRSRAGRELDVICIIDVIEHIPENERRQVFQKLAGIAASDCMLVLTYPSPEYQRHLLSNEPNELQVIDNIVELSDLIAEARPSGWNLRSFNYVDIWRTNQYIHAVFARSTDLAARNTDTQRSIFKRIGRKIDRVVLRPRRVRKYKERPFVNWSIR